MDRMSSFGPLAEAEVTYVGDMDEAGMIKSCLLQIGLPAIGTRENFRRQRQTSGTVSFTKSHKA